MRAVAVYDYARWLRERDVKVWVKERSVSVKLEANPKVGKVFGVEVVASAHLRRPCLISYNQTICRDIPKTLLGCVSVMCPWSRDHTFPVD